MDSRGATLVWFRRDLRLSDHLALTAAVAIGDPIIPVFICDETCDALGAAPKWRLALGLEQLDLSLKECGSTLILRQGEAHQALQQLLEETKGARVFWSRAYDPTSIRRDTHIKQSLRDNGIDARSFGGQLLFEPTAIKTKAGGIYSVFTPFWKSVRNLAVDAPIGRPNTVPGPNVWPKSESLQDLQFGVGMKRGAPVVRPYLRIGEDAALSRLSAFVDDKIAHYQDNRDFPGQNATSGLSENLALGEISPQQCWHAGKRAMAEGKAGAETFLKELTWREFASYLLVHNPNMLTESWRPGWSSFPWSEGETTPEVLAWKQGRTGIPIVDAGMREMYVTGRMHNRVRMIVASYLTKHLMTHWRIGQAWFEDCLIDWDAASNAMGWQWVAGCGPDAAPYFRIFNPQTQRDKFDADGSYINRWIAEIQADPPSTALAYFQAIPKSWNMSPKDAYPAPIVTLEAGRKRALGAYQNRGF